MKIFALRLGTGISALVMMAVYGASFRKGSVSAVMAFSISSKTTPSSARTRAASSSSRFQWGKAAFGRPPRLSEITTLRQSTMIDSIVDLEKSLEVTHPAYEVLQRDVVTEYGAYCTLFKHKNSGAELLSVSTDDDNKVFGVTFRTPPQDSTGVPHILEHSVLCGSRKYKTKDPFVHLLKGSLQTFLNAFTYPDRTCYVVASQNEKDFYNLINVYADAVFHPRAIDDPTVHAQEGWHLELEDPNEPLTYKGVVYNEMKGVYSSPDSLLNRFSQRSIFPDNTYAVDSGGDPKVIPELSFEQFAEFHRKYYHPSNARVYFSGDDDVYARLELMDSYLHEFNEAPEVKSKSAVTWQKRKFTEPHKVTHQYPAGADQPETHMMMVSWLLNDQPLTAFEELTLGVVDHLLMGTTSSILHKTLMESGLGEAITGGGVSDELLQATFSVGLKGVSPDKVSDVENLILSTLQKVADEGFTDDDIASSLNTIEFQMREFNTGSFPKGLSFMLGSMSKWIYDESPTSGLKFEEPLAMLKAEIAKSGTQVFQDMVRKLLVENTHRSIVELTPSKTLEDEIVKEEQDRLAAIKSQLSSDAINQIIQNTVELKRLQASEDTPEARATIPSLVLEDLKRECTEYPISVSENENGSGITVIRHELGSTSGIAYVNLAVDLSELSLEDVILLPILTKIMTETGAGEYDSVALSRRIGTHTGGIGVSTMITAVNTEGADESTTSTGDNIQAKLVITGKATSEKIDELLSLVILILTDARLDSKSKVVEMLKESRSKLESRIQGAGHSMVNTRMKSRYRAAAYIDEITSGISYLDTLKRLIKQAEDDWPSLLDSLIRVRNTLLNPSTARTGMILDITGERSVLNSIQASVDKFIVGLPGDSAPIKSFDAYKDCHPWVEAVKMKMATSAPIKDEGFVVPTQVSYVGKSGLLYETGERIPGSAAVVSRFLRTGYLWDYVRVIGGAYGGFCTFSPFSGFFSFLSYRDPNLSKTLDVYDAAANALFAAADAMETDRDALQTAIIGTIGDTDGALSPDQKGFTAFQRWLINESPEYRQQYRNEILETKPNDFREFAVRLQNMKNVSIAVVSSKAKFEEAAALGKEMDLVQVL